MKYGEYKLYISSSVALYNSSKAIKIINIADSFSKEEWKALSPQEQEEFLNSLAQDLANNLIDYGWSEFEP